MNEEVEQDLDLDPIRREVENTSRDFRISKKKMYQQDLTRKGAVQI